MAPIAKRRKLEQPAELTFDFAARQDYLTGFHKRKLQRIKRAKEEAVKQDKEDKVRDRRQLREQRKEDLERHVKEVDTLVRAANPDMSDAEEGEGEVDEEDVEWGGIEESNKVDGTDEYVDEEKYTTVTIEAMDDAKDALKAQDEEADAAKAAKAIKDKEEAATLLKKKKPWMKERHGDEGPKAKKKKFRYETKAERKQVRQKQAAKNHKAAKARRDED